MLADETGDGPQLGKYRVRLDDLDSVGAKAVENALNSDLIIVDEIGPMELSSRRFILAPCRRATGSSGSRRQLTFVTRRSSRTSR